MAAADADGPHAAEGRSKFGRTEGDLVIGSNNDQATTLGDRESRFLTMELAAPKRFAGVDVSFAAPRSPWQRGTDKLLR